MNLQQYRNETLLSALHVYECPYSKKRFGSHHDCGYVIADDITIINYDFGIFCGLGYNISFEEEFGRTYPFLQGYGIDPYCDHPEFLPENIKYLSQKVENCEELNHAIDIHTNMFLKMDIDGGEWDWFESLGIEQLKKFRQIVVEFHQIKSNTGEKWDVFKKLASTHFLVHAHGNNYSDILNISDCFVPNVIELTYIRRENNFLPKNVTKLPIQYIDYPNDSVRPDYDLTHYPFCASLDSPENHNKSSVIFVTAIKDLGRSKWSGFERTMEHYTNWFGFLLKNVRIRLICFCEPYMATFLDDKFGFKNCYPYDEANTYFRYLEKEREIIQSEKYRELARNRPNPEYNFAEYNIVNHNKCLFVQRAKRMFPSYSHYGWIDFGCWRDETLVIKDFDWSKLQHNMMHFETFYIPSPENIKEPAHLCWDGEQIIKGSIYIVPHSLVDWYVGEYTKMLEYYHTLNVVDDDQAIIQQIYKRFPEKFSLHIEEKWFQLLHIFECQRKIDIVIPVGNKDIDTLKLCVERVQKYIQDVGEIYIICNNQISNNFSKILEKYNVNFVSEDSFPFQKVDIEKYLTYKNVHTHHSTNWFYQQLLKLYAYKVIPNIRRQIFIVDSETIFYQPFSLFSGDNKAIYPISNEVVKPYNDHMKRILPGTQEWNLHASGIVHCMLFEENVLNEIFDRSIQSYYHKTGRYIPFWEIMIHELEPNIDICIYSEYNIYFNYVMQYRSYQCKPENILWDISGYIPEDSKNVYLTCHNHLRNRPIKEYRYRVHTL